MMKNNFKKIKTATLLLITVSFVLASCAQPQPSTPKEVSIIWSEIEQGVGLEVGDILEVVLPANPSTGYMWEVGFYNQSVLKPGGKPEFLSSNAQLGAQGSQKLHFEAVGEGETELVLVYRRSFENEGSSPQIFQVTVVVN